MSAQPLPEEAPSMKRPGLTLFVLNDDGVSFATTVELKRDLLKAHPAAALFVAWTGQWSTNIFTIERDRAMAELGMR